MSAAAPEPVTTATTGETAAPAGSNLGDSDDVRQPIRMLADRLLAKPAGDAGERKNRAGILIPATANVERRLVWATIVAVGPTVRAIAEGDRVLYAPDTGFEVEIRGEDYLILREREIHAVASERIDDRTGLYL
ncbi:MAG: Co-chaperonin GroES [Actinomycetia bacterium]|nr:Co-chaperonin GroES [Actinomycetes bacterium]